MATINHKLEDLMRDIYTVLSDSQKTKLRGVHTQPDELVGYMELGVTRDPQALQQLVLGRAVTHHSATTLRHLEELERETEQKRRKLE